jgi:hypothetical protein
VVALPLRTARFASGLSVVAFAALALVLATACGDGGDEGSTPALATPTNPDSTPLPPDWPTGVLTLADVDFSAAPVVDQLLELSNGGAVTQERVALYDLVSDDDVLEAIVFVESGGTLGDIGLAVYELRDTQPRLVTYIEAAGRVEFDADLELLFSYEGVYEDGDAECCPSKLREVAYGWDGERFAVVSDQVVENDER